MFPSKKPLLIILGVLVLACLTYNFQIAEAHKYEASGDAWSFVNLGFSLAKTGKYGTTNATRDSLIADFKTNSIENKTYHFSKHITWRPPIWPFLIASVFTLFGYSLSYLLIFKFCLHLLGIYLFYKTLKLLNFKVGLIIIGTFLYGIHPTWQIYSRFFLSEPVTFFFLTLFIYYFIKFAKNKSSILPQAIVSGILILAHPYYIFFPFSIWIVFFLYKSINIKQLLLSGFICSLILFSWVLRNALVLDTSTPVLTTSSGAVMAKGWNKNVVEEHTNTKGDLANEELVLEDYPHDKTAFYNEVTRSKLYTKASLHFIKNNPKQIVPIILTKLKSAFNPFPETSKPGILELGRVLFQLISLLALLALIFISKNKLIKSLAIGLILSTIGIAIITYSGFRFRMPQIGLELLLILVCVQGIQNYYTIQNKPRQIDFKQ